MRWLTRPELDYDVGLVGDDDAGESLTIIVFLMLSADECCLLGRGGRLVCYIYINSRAGVSVQSVSQSHSSSLECVYAPLANPIVRDHCGCFVMGDPRT